MVNVMSELQTTLEKLGSKCQEARDVMGLILSDTELGMGHHPDGGGTIVVRQATEDSWPRETWSAEDDSPYEVNEYRYYGSARAYSTLRSDDVLRSRPVQPIYTGVSHYPGDSQSAFCYPNSRNTEWLSEGAVPRTLSSMQDGRTASGIRSAPVPVQSNWPAVPRERSDTDTHHSVDGGGESASGNLIPKGIENRRKSSGYATIGIEIDPDRPPADLPKVPEYHYDTPLLLTPDPSSTAPTSAPPPPPEVANGGLNLARNAIVNNEHGEEVVPPECCGQEEFALSHQHPLPHYVNHQVKRNPNKTSGYSLNIKGSKTQHAVDD